ncbi:uncharacterized protein VTP21DRAFT_3134 [Calcarisporiella thermophila]|uniref:uncharacterized protein n=1 Tax=Calcarisporiella thermophila TaxID=911321 RepID=UPI003742C2EE
MPTREEIYHDYHAYSLPSMQQPPQPDSQKPQDPNEIIDGDIIELLEHINNLPPREDRNLEEIMINLLDNELKQAERLRKLTQYKTAELKKEAAHLRQIIDRLPPPPEEPLDLTFSAPITSREFFQPEHTPFTPLPLDMLGSNWTSASGSADASIVNTPSAILDPRLSEEIEAHETGVAQVNLGEGGEKGEQEGEDEGGEEEEEEEEEEDEEDEDEEEGGDWDEDDENDDRVRMALAHMLAEFGHNE